MVDEQRDRNHLPQKHYLGVLGKFQSFYQDNSRLVHTGSDRTQIWTVFWSRDLWLTQILARAAWFAYLNPKDTDLLYYNWFRRRDNWSPTEDLFDKGLFQIYFHYGSRDFTSESVDWFATYRSEITPGYYKSYF